MTLYFWTFSMIIQHVYYICSSHRACLYLFKTLFYRAVLESECATTRRAIHYLSVSPKSCMTRLIWTDWLPRYSVCFMQSSLIWFYPVRSTSVQYKPVQSNRVQLTSVQPIICTFI